MSIAAENMVTISVTELERIIQRAVRDSLRGEMRRALSKPVRDLLYELEHEGPDDPPGDEMVLAEALEMLDRYANDHKDWITLDELETELAVEQANAVSSQNLSGGA